MRCTACKVEIPYDKEYAENLQCLFCGASTLPTAEDFLTYPELNIAREFRPPQAQLTTLIDKTSLHGGITLIEAGTGVGKSFAYLLPAILSGKRTLVTTAKKSLQSQLFEKDLPFLSSKLAQSKIFFKYAMAYGKSNYICQRETLRSSSKERIGWKAFEDEANTWTWDELDRLKKVGKGKKKLEVLRFDQDKTPENCVGRTCKHFESGCSYVEDRAAMLEANVVVTNHWLFGYHLKLTRTMDYPLLGSFKNIIVDEAHKLEDGVRSAFTDSISDKRLNKLISTFENGVLGDGREFPYKKTLLGEWRQLFSRVSGRADAKDNSVADFGQEAHPLLDIIDVVITHMANPQQCVDMLGADSNNTRITSAVSAYLVNTKVKASVPSDTETLSDAPDDVRTKWYIYKRTYEELRVLHDMVNDAVNMKVNQNLVTYIDKTAYGNQISIAPVEIGQYMSHLYKDPAKVSVHYLSATLAVNNQMDVFARRVGLDPQDSRVQTCLLGSAFDLKKQATLFIARGVPEPSRDIGKEEYRAKLSEHILELTSTNGGNAFVLFTAKDEMLDVYSRIQHNSQHPILVQDGVSAADLLKQYRSTPDSILFGLKSFWEGVDVAGDKLSLVIITKLPFPGRTDPVVNARRAKAGNAWFSYVDVPDMIFDLRQGVGRLIRTTSDTGMVAILDARLLSKPYGKAVVKSTGFTQAHTDLDKACAILRNYAANRV